MDKFPKTYDLLLLHIAVCSLKQLTEQLRKKFSKIALTRQKGEITEKWSEIVAKTELISALKVKLDYKKFIYFPFIFSFCLKNICNFKTYDWEKIIIRRQTPSSFYNFT